VVIVLDQDQRRCSQHRGRRRVLRYGADRRMDSPSG
jgi:hypothetical protein